MSRPADQLTRIESVAAHDVGHPDVVVVHASGSSSDELIGCLRAARIRTASVAVDRQLIGRIDALGPRAVVVDHGPEFDLVRVCRDIRAASPARIIAISDGGPEDHPSRLPAFAAGADDHLARMGAPRRLIARVLAVLTRDAEPRPDMALVRIGDVQLDFTYRHLVIAGQRTGCSDHEFALVAALAERPNMPVSHEDLISRLWGPTAPRQYRRRLRIQVSRIRNLIGHGPGRPEIVGVLGVGYQLLVPHGVLHVDVSRVR